MNLLSSIWNRDFAFFNIAEGNFTKDLLKEKVDGTTRTDVLNNKMSNVATTFNYLKNPNEVVSILDDIQKLLNQKILSSIKFEKKLSGRKDYGELSIKEKVAYWTDLYHNNILNKTKNNNNDLDNKMLIYSVLLSKEFAEEVTDKYNYSILSRHALYSPENFSNQTEQQIVSDLKKAFTGKKANNIADSIMDAIWTGLSDDDKENKRNEIISNIKNNVSNYKGNDSQFFKRIIKKAVDNEVIRQIEQFEKSGNYSITNFKFVFKYRKKDLLIYNYNKNNMSPLRDKQLGNNLKERLINYLVEFCKTHNGKLSLGSYGTIDIENFSNRNEINEKYVRTIIKLEKIDVSNYGNELQGYLAELVNALKKDTIITGKIKDKIELSNGKKLSLGQSFRDTKRTTEEGITYGYNIKHYIKTGEQIFSLYKDKKDESIGLFSSYLYRYFDKKTVLILRYIEANYNFFQQMGLNTYNLNENSFSEGLRNIAIYNSSYFLRAESPILIDNNQDIGNAFYIINNIVIPTSVIYTLLEEQIYKNFSKKNKQEPLIQINGSFFKDNTNYNLKKIQSQKEGNKEYDIYRKRYLENPTANILKKKSNSHRIKFNGLTISLKDLYNQLKD